jgi:putative phosphoribosyl transferase
MFADRTDAGIQLAGELRSLKLHDPIVLAIPRGGVVTGAAIARELGADLDVVLSRKLRAPYRSELAIGAVGEDGEVYISDLELVVSVSQAYIEKEQRHQLREIKRRKKLFRAARPQASIADRSVILTDDAIATGSTMIAAIRVVKAQNPREIIVAIPTAPAASLADIRGLCDRLICLRAPADFYAVGQFYRTFDPVEDREVAHLLQQFASRARQTA